MFTIEPEPPFAHAILLRCEDGLPLLRSETLCGWLADAIDRSRIQERFFVLAYVIMPDHARFLIRSASPALSIARVLDSVAGPPEHRVSAQLERTLGPIYRRLSAPETGSWERGKRPRVRLWEPGGVRHEAVRAERYARSLQRAIHDAPVRAGLVDRAIDWRWCSASAYRGRSGPVAVDVTMGDADGELPVRRRQTRG